MIKVICLSSNSDAMEKGHGLVQKLSKRCWSNCRVTDPSLFYYIQVTIVTFSPHEIGEH